MKPKTSQLSKYGINSSTVTLSQLTNLKNSSRINDEASSDQTNDELVHCIFNKSHKDLEVLQFTHNKEDIYKVKQQIDESNIEITDLDFLLTKIQENNWLQNSDRLSEL